MSEEWFDILDKSCQPIGKALRSVCHANPGLLHAAVHVLVFDHTDRLFLQKRSSRKDLLPNCWDTSVGGHLRPGENPRDGALRELHEELGVKADVLHDAYQYIWQSPNETEFITAYATFHEGPFNLCPDEISEGRFWSLDEIQKGIREGVPALTPNFRFEYPRMEDWLRSFRLSAGKDT